MFKSIKTQKDIQEFLEATKRMHDGHVIGVQYANKGITRTGNTVYYHPEQTVLTLQILVTSIWDTAVEIEFEDLYEWQIKESTPLPYSIHETSVAIQGDIFWSNEIDANTIDTDAEELKRNLYVIAQSMKWRVVK